MRTRLIVAVIALAAALMACSPPPQPSRDGVWDQSNFETATWN